MNGTVAEINLKNLVHNLNNIRKRVSPAKVMAVVKADAYGHGAIPITKQLAEEGVNYFAVAWFEEGMELRTAGITKDILVFGRLLPSEIPAAIDNNLTLTIANGKDIDLVNEIAKQKGKIAKVHINVDTGMGRIGLLYDEALPFILSSLNKKYLNIEGIYSHFATSDKKDKTYAYKQLSKFQSLLKQLNDRGVKIPIVHMANSGAVLDIPESYFDMVRVGISLYGHYPSTETSESIPLKQVMTLKTKVLLVRRIPKGANISYGCRYQTQKDTNIATLPIGYADGIFRYFTNIGKVLINGNLYPIVGTVTMDQIMVDVRNDPIKEGDEVIIWGNSPEGEIQAAKIAKQIGTISYELCCSVSKRVPRIYIVPNLRCLSP